ncbi:MAG: hypothetical protein M1816_006760 [Peltula sp. TS41687]|nr:MAG: hypothetical protein M1816_006760 [Peltula sp. TS41687]
MSASDSNRSPSAIPTTEVDQSEISVKREVNPEESTVTAEEWRAMQSVLDAVYAYRDTDGHDPSKLFHRKVNKRAVPDYYETIREPIALSTVKAKINTKEYRQFSEFVRDFALIPHNAQIYNRPSCAAYKDALTIKVQSVIESELQKLVDQKIISAEVAVLPDLGEIPPVSPRLAEQEGEEDEDDEDEDEDDDGEDSDEEGSKRRRKRGPRSSLATSKREDNVKSNDVDARRKRGRPPRVDTPLEARIKAVLKGLRKIKGPGGELKVSHFEKLPDKTSYPGYFTEIKNPMALDLIKRKSKRKKYQSVDQLMKDVELMFENAKTYNRDDSQIHKDAVELQKEARSLAEQEKKKPDSDYMMEDGKLPLPNGILYNNELWKVGDWVHIQNPNDLNKPIVGQIYRTWQDPEGQKWVNACWYYRPEQTVHRFDRHFYENEVVKTGQYRDHNIEEVLDRCFVMFFTRFPKGRPRDFPPDKEVYVCESRYNEEKHKLNKIKTWASCLPDEVREKDYQMDMFETPNKMKKVPSPIKHLLPADAKETDDLPKPTWGLENAPPIVGAVHRRPREANESPPPEPTPSPPPPATLPPAQAGQGSISRTPQVTNGTSNHQGMSSQSAGYSSKPYSSEQYPKQSPLPPTPSSSSSSSSSSQHQQQPPHQPATNRQPSSQPTIHPVSMTPVPLPPSAARTPPAQSAHPHQQPGYASTQTPTSSSSYNYTAASLTPPRPIPMPMERAGGGGGGGGGTGSFYQPPKPVEVYHLLDHAQAGIPAEVTAQFHHDDQGHILFFTAPPVETLPPYKQGQALGHSVHYLAEKARRAEKRKAAAAAAAAAGMGMEMEMETTVVQKRQKTGADGEREKQQRELDEEIKRLKLKSLEIWTRQLRDGMEGLYTGF